jgi:hypothetical protein
MRTKIIFLAAAFAALFLGTGPLGCDDGDDNFGDSDGGDADTDSDGDSDGDADTDTDTGTDTGTGTEIPDCGSDEITDGDTGLTWLRCPAGATWEWSGGSCRCTGGLTYTRTWEQAQTSCPDGFRVPTIEEMMGVLGPCESWATIEANGEGDCQACSLASKCQELFGVDGKLYWTATEDAVDSLLAWSAWFNVGLVASQDRTITYYVRCVSP